MLHIVFLSLTYTAFSLKVFVPYNDFQVTVRKEKDKKD